MSDSQMVAGPIRVTLASSSPRRRELLQTLGVPFSVEIPNIVEQRRVGEEPVVYAQRNAAEKCQAIARARGEAKQNHELVIAADTIVVLGNDVLEKPDDQLMARQMLQRLSGQVHKVISGVSLGVRRVGSTQWQHSVFYVETAVTMKVLHATEIAAYVATGEPLDKAGGYAAQGIGSYMVKSIVGSYANVVGLPIAEMCEQLETVHAISLWDIRAS